MSSNQEFYGVLTNCAPHKDLAVLEAEKIVKWASCPINPGDTVKAQIRRASNELRINYGTCKKAWYRLAGVETYAALYNAKIALLERREAMRASSPWSVSADGLYIFPTMQAGRCNSEGKNRVDDKTNSTSCRNPNWLPVSNKAFGNGPRLEESRAENSQAVCRGQKKRRVV